MLWSYFSVNDCKPVAFKGDTHMDDAQLVKAITAKYAEADMQRGIWGRFGWMGFGLAIVAGLALWLQGLVSGKRDEDDEKAAEKAT